MPQDRVFLSCLFVFTTTDLKQYKTNNIISDSTKCEIFEICKSKDDLST